MAKNMELPRRQFLAALGAAAGLKLCAQNQEDETVAYLRSLVRTRDWVAGFLNKKPMIAGYHANFGWVYDPDLGCRADGFLPRRRPGRFADLPHL